MKKLLIIALALLLLCLTSACSQNKADANVGSWSITESTEMTAEAQNAFEKAMEGLMGVDYTPVALLGTQLVSGTNYCILCEATAVYPDAQPYLALVYIYADLQGSAKVSGVIALDPGNILEIGIIQNTQAQSGMLGGWKVDRSGSVYAEGAVMHLASQMVSGTNHCILCSGWNLTFVYEDLEGTTEVLRTIPLEIGVLSQLAD